MFVHVVTLCVPTLWVLCLMFIKRGISEVITFILYFVQSWCKIIPKKCMPFIITKINYFTKLKKM